jgi:hypothetical protein
VGSTATETGRAQNGDPVINYGALLQERSLAKKMLQIFRLKRSTVEKNETRLLLKPKLL